MNKPDFALLWNEECDILHTLAKGVPEGGTIVEIGTALGGSGVIFADATQGRNVKIYSVDVSPSPRAYQNLNDSGVEIISLTSLKFSECWGRDVRRQIDLLFIDGNHSFQGVYEDFNNWSPHLCPGGSIVFHDYDQKERGGLAHLGVRVCLDTLMVSSLLLNPVHAYRLLHATIVQPDLAKITLTSCYGTFASIGQGIIEIRKKLFSQSIREGIDMLRKREPFIDSMQACYCIAYALKKDFDYLDQITNSVSEFRKWTELLSFFEDGFGVLKFPDDVEITPKLLSAEELSRMIAREQVRLSLLAQITKTLVDWKL
ncbi:MAG: class I SAM-dependent methyltransferase [bacterium]|nr:class I SAM-dependent methyltransferase [bacterium]